MRTVLWTTGEYSNTPYRLEYLPAALDMSWAADEKMRWKSEPQTHSHPGGKQALAMRRG